MVTRVCWIFFVMVFAMAPQWARAQVSEAEESEVVKSASRSQAADKTPDLAEAVKQIVGQTNEFREEEKRSPVEADSKLTETAQYFADFMARTDKYGHTADGNQPSQRARKHGYEYCLISENIAYQYSSAGFSTEDLARRFVDGWKNSPGHRKNMLEAGVTETGVAVARSEKSGNYYAVQMFARPKSKAIEFTITNESSTEVEYQIGEKKFPLPARLTRTHQMCRDAEIKFDWPKGDSSTVKAGNKGDYVVVEEGDRLRLKGE